MSEPILKLVNVSRYFGSLAAVKSMSLEVQAGEIYGIAGPNGSGKTTLINTITRIISANEGEIYFQGRPIHNLSSFNICHLGVARTFQNPEIFSSLSVADNLLMGATYGPKQDLEGFRAEHIRRILQFVGLEGKEESSAGRLIISQKKKLMLGIALATNPRLLILDEPCAGLTAIESKEMISLIGRLRQQGVTLMVIEHNMKVLMSISSRVMIMNHGVKICEGPPDDVSCNEEVIQLYLGKKFLRRSSVAGSQSY